MEWRVVIPFSCPDDPSLDVWEILHLIYQSPPPTTGSKNTRLTFPDYFATGAWAVWLRFHQLDTPIPGSESEAIDMYKLAPAVSRAAWPVILQQHWPMNSLWWWKCAKIDLLICRNPSLLYYPTWQPLATYGDWALEMWLVPLKNWIKLYLIVMSLNVNNHVCLVVTYETVQFSRSRSGPRVGGVSSFYYRSGLRAGSRGVLISFAVDLGHSWLGSCQAQCPGLPESYSLPFTKFLFCLYCPGCVCVMLATKNPKWHRWDVESSSF